MLTLYYSPGACSLSPHIVLREAGLAFELDKVSFGTKKTSDGGDFLAVNPKGSVPVLRLDDGQVLTEGPAIVQYLADRNPDAKLAPPAGTMERYRLQEWLNFITSELHKGYSPLFRPTTPEEYKAIARENLLKKYEFVDSKLAGRNYLMGDQFTVADAYLFTVTTWAKHVGVDLSKFANVGAFMARMSARPAVQAALEAEGLVKKAA